jgi:hypothetical protein
VVKSPDEKVLDSLMRHMARVEQDPLTPLLDRYFLERDLSENRLDSYLVNMSHRPRPRGRLSPSRICGCKRQAAFAFVGMPARRVVDPDTQGIFDDGDWRHHRWQATFLDMEKVLGVKTFKVVSIEEGTFHEPLYIAGSMDAVVRINGELWVIDFKGINSWGFERVYREHEPHRAHVLQLISYMRARKIKRGILMYEHKDKNATKCFVVRFTPKAFEEVASWCTDVLTDIEEHELPPMALDCQAGTMLFEKCPWASVCFGEHSPSQIRRRMYRDFPGIDEVWEEGKRIVEEHTVAVRSRLGVG